MLYATSAGLHAFALDAATGRELWRFDPVARGRQRRRARGQSRRRLLERGPRAAHPLQRRPDALRARRGDRPSRPRLRARGARRSRRGTRPRPRRGLRAGDDARRRLRRPADPRQQRWRGAGPRRARPRARLRRPHGRRALELPHHPTARRVRLRQLASRRVEDGGRCQLVERAECRPRARARVRAHGLADFRLLGRRPQGREPLRQLPDRAPGRDRGARVALPAGAPRPVGPRPAPGTRAARRAAGRADDRRGRAGDQVGARVRVRPRERRAAVRDRGAPRPGLGPRGRGGLEDAAAAAPAARVLAPGLRRGGRDRHLPRFARRRARAAAPGAQRRPVRAAEHAGHGHLPGLRRRRRVGRIRVRPRDAPALRERQRDALDPRDARGAEARRAPAGRARLRAALRRVPRRVAPGRSPGPVSVARRARDASAAGRHARHRREGQGRDARLRVPVARRARCGRVATHAASPSPTPRRARPPAPAGPTRTSATTASSTPRATPR